MEAERLAYETTIKQLRNRLEDLNVELKLNIKDMSDLKQQYFNKVEEISQMKMTLLQNLTDQQQTDYKKQIISLQDQKN